MSNNPFDKPHWEKKAELGRPQFSVDKPLFSFDDSPAEEFQNDKNRRMYKEALVELNAIEGMDGVVSKVKEAIALATIFKEREKHNLKNELHSLHMVFTGNAGTGKTTVARLVGKLFIGSGLLVKGNFPKTEIDQHVKYIKSRVDEDVPFVECTNAEITSSFYGEEERNVKRKFDEANGGVLFLDEAYSLIPNTRSDKVGAILVSEMENRRKAVCVIGAGYPKEMEKFLQSNSGLASRFSTVIHFPNYSVDVLEKIALGMAKERDYILNADYLVKLKERLEKERLHPYFGNGRTVRNIIEESIRKQAFRLSEKYGSTPSREHLITLTEEDLGEYNPVMSGKKIVDPFEKLFTESLVSGEGIKRHRGKNNKQEEFDIY